MDLAEIGDLQNMVDEGGWVVTIPHLKDIKLKVRASDSAAHLTFWANARTKFGDDFPKPEIQKELEAEALSGIVLVDWRNVTDNKVEVPFSPEKARELLVKFDVFRRGINYAATVVAEVGKKNLDAAVGNSPPSSDGASSGIPTAKGSKS